MKIEEQIAACRYIDQLKLFKQLKKLEHFKSEDKKSHALLKLQAQIQLAQQKVLQKQNNLPQLNYPALPIFEQKEKILKLLQSHQVIIIAGETGSGKSTQLGKICLEAGLGLKGFIGHTQPRRIAAMSIAKRVSQELKSPVGEAVGYKIRFQDRSDERNYIKVLTDGMLLAETQNDRLLLNYDVIIVDEAHERSLNIDILLGLLKRIINKRSDLKIIVTSATIQLEKFSRFFNEAPIVEVSGRQYPVENRFLLEPNIDTDMTGLIVECVKKITQEGPGDILIFQSGEKEIREVIDVLDRLKLRNTTIMPLYSRLNQQQQQQIFKSVVGRKIVVTTNVAETSITVPNIRFVIDSGLHKVNRYNYKNKLHRLDVEAISQASVMQRRGRCGRVGPGIYYALFTEEDFTLRPIYAEPEILRSSLAKVLLSLMALNIKDTSHFPFVDAPDSKYIKDGLRLLRQLEAVDENFGLTDIGRLMARVPIEPRLARILIEADRQNCLNEMLIIGSGLSIVDPREEPYEKRQQAREKHAQYADPKSEFLSYIHLWQAMHLNKKASSHKEFVSQCRKNYLSYVRICEWIDLHKELKNLCVELKLRTNQKPAEYSQVHLALLKGFIDTIGLKEEKNLYLGARGLKFMVHPGSYIKKTDSWVLAGEIFHSSKTFAKNIAHIEVDWLLSQGQHLIKKSYLEPYFDINKQSVVAVEKSQLFGLPIHSQRIHYENINPQVASDIFIRDGLVENQLACTEKFYTSNIALIKRIQSLEHRTRYYQSFINDEALFLHYKSLLKNNVSSLKQLKSWVKHNDTEKLCFTLSDFIDEDSLSQLLESYPDVLQLDTIQLPITYAYQPGDINDGATLNIGLDILPFVIQQDLSWIIPAWLKERILYDLKILPKVIRQRIPPLKNITDKIYESICYGQGQYYDVLAKYLFTQYKVSIHPKDFVAASDCLPEYLRWHYKILDANGMLVEAGDNLALLYERLKAQGKIQTLPIQSQSLSKEDVYINWEFPDLPESQIKTLHNKSVTVFPAIVAGKEGVHIDQFSSLEQALQYHALGLCQLYTFKLSSEIKYLKKQIKNKNIFKLAQKYFPEGANTVDNLVQASVYHCFVARKPDIRSQKDFQKHLTQQKPQLLSTFNGLNKIFTNIIEAYQVVYQKCYLYRTNKRYAPILTDINQQLEGLFSDEYLMKADYNWLSRYPIYLQAIIVRLEKYLQNAQVDKKSMQEIKSLEKLLQNKLDSEFSDTKDTLRLSISDNSQKMNTLKYKIEELRVSLFAQKLGTSLAVSSKRLLKELQV
tara:strand:+ start:55605 stop:59462 length:3858 start_codon:yes stop_codon:yes gene_type:complete